MNTLSIDYPEEILWALQQDPEEFEKEARLLASTQETHSPDPGRC